MPIGKSICVAAILSLPPVTVGIKLINKEPYRTSAGATASNFPDGEDFYSNCWLLAGCKWENAVDNNNKSIDDARQCSCNRNPDKWDELIWFYTKANFKGDIYKGFGHWGECQDLPKIWNGRAESIQITVPDILCCVYTQQGCNKDSGLFTQRDGTEPEEQSVAEFQGQFYKGVHSFKCSKKFNALTTCNYP